jgi:predicted PurR-regulated permease PerM
VTTNRFYNVVSLFLVILFGYLTYHILQPFLKAIAWAVVFAIVFYPVYKFVLKYLRFKALASTVTLIIVVALIMGPFTYLSFVLIDELGNLIQNINGRTLDSVSNYFAHSHIAWLIDKIQSKFEMQGISSVNALSQSVKTLGGAITSSLSAGITNLAGMIINFILMLFALFFFLRDGSGFLPRIYDYLPFSEENKIRLIARVKDMVISTVYGGVLIALIQGILGGFAFFFLGIESPVLWGSAMTIMSFLPLLGTFSVWGPAAIYLFIQGSYIKGIVLILYGVLVISMVDNILRPMIISGRTKMPTLAVFFSVLGGIKVFGLIGFIMGPLVLALFVALFEIFRQIEGGENA